MSKNKLSFESEKLVVDYISFNIPGSDNTEYIAKYLFEKFNVNSTFAKGQNGTTDDWFYLPVNQHQVSFRQLEYDPSLKEGKKLVKDRQKDFQFIFLMKEQDSYVFTNESIHFKILTREIITKALNLVTCTFSEEISSKPNITSHSFRIGYITQLWKDSKDIEFVKQIIAHRNLDTTSAYVKKDRNVLNN